MKRLTVISIMVLAVTGIANGGSVYKCTDTAGNVTFSQSICPAKTSSIKEMDYSEPPRSRSPKSNSSLSPQKQLQQMEADKNKWNISGQSSKSRRLHKKKCNYYRKQARKYRGRYGGHGKDEGMEIHYLEMIENYCN